MPDARPTCANRPEVKAPPRRETMPTHSPKTNPKQLADRLEAPSAPARATVPHGTNASAVYESLRQRIGTSFYAPGSRLTEVEIAREFGVSRTPVRQALHRLGAEGLVEVKNGVGVRVTEIDDRELEDMYKLRLKLVEMIGDLSPQALSPEDLAAVAQIRERIRQMRDQSTEPAIGDYTKLCDQFYAVVNRVIGNSFLRHFIDVMYHQTDRYWYGWMQSEDLRREVGYLYQEVDETLSALEKSDLQSVGLIRRNHITMMLERMATYRRGLTKS
jgi:DNA-binding GntR family transcriptional regulator